MLACVDVDYREGCTIAACILFESWTDAHGTKEIVVRTGAAAPYRSGEFFRRELPAILAVLERVTVPLDAVVIDGYVWLGGASPGLGAYLHEALSKRVAVVGVAKTAWSGQVTGAGIEERRAIPLRRGRSDKPLYVTTAGMDLLLAAALVAQMHGSHRIPTLIKAVDRLVRDAPA
jgi:deoxyribonuclease V